MHTKKSSVYDRVFLCIIVYPCIQTGVCDVKRSESSYSAILITFVISFRI